MAFFRSGYTVQYVGVDMPSRGGKSHLSPWRDGVRFGLIIFRIGTLYAAETVYAHQRLFAALERGNYLYTFILGAIHEHERLDVGFRGVDLYDRTGVRTDRFAVVQTRR